MVRPRLDIRMEDQESLDSGEDATGDTFGYRDVRHSEREGLEEDVPGGDLADDLRHGDPQADGAGSSGFSGGGVSCGGLEGREGHEAVGSAGRPVAPARIHY